MGVVLRPATVTGAGFLAGTGFLLSTPEASQTDATR
jgi:hypothetical protein